MTLPEDVLMHIATFLPYNERVEMNRVLPIEYRFVKKIDSDGHNRAYKVKLLQDKVISVRSCSYFTNRLTRAKKMYLYLLHTKDTTLFDMSPKLYHTILEKTRECTDLTMFDADTLRKHRREIMSMIKVCECLVSKLESMIVPTETKPYKFVNVV